MDNNQIASRFWKTIDRYPAYDNIKQRRFYEIKYVLHRIGFGRIGKLVDVGCGDGGFVKCLDNLLEIDTIYCYDYSLGLMSNITDTKFIKQYFDCNDSAYLSILPTCDLLMFGGVINFVFDDHIAVQLMSCFDARHIFIRTPCTTQSQSQLISTYSHQLGADYSCLYRTEKDMIAMIGQSGMTINDIVDIYPPTIDSKYDTRQKMFHCTKQKE